MENTLTALRFEIAALRKRRIELESERRTLSALAEETERETERLRQARTAPEASGTNTIARVPS